MISPNTVFVVVLVLFFSSVLVVVLLVWRRAQRAAGPSLDHLLARLAAVDRQRLSVVAMEPRDRAASSEAEDLEGWQLWELIGGLAGVEAMAANCEVLIDLACYVQRWYPEALPVAEQLRLHAREVQWHLERLRGAESRGHLQAVFADYAERVVTLYCGMTEHVLALYEVSQVPGRADLLARI